AQGKAHPARLALILARHEDRAWPKAASAQAMCGSWNAAVEAAGFPTMDPGMRRDPETHRLHLKGSRQRGGSVKAAGVIRRELDRNEVRTEKLKEELRNLETEHGKLLQAAAIFNGGVKQGA